MICKTCADESVGSRDVGSGKTVVAVIGILAAIQSGYQAALMSPTEVLAEQHYRKLVSWFNLLHLELLTGSTKAAKRRKSMLSWKLVNCHYWWVLMP